MDLHKELYGIISLIVLQAFITFRHAITAFFRTKYYRFVNHRITKSSRASLKDDVRTKFDGASSSSSSSEVTDYLINDALEALGSTNKTNFIEARLDTPNLKRVIVLRIPSLDYVQKLIDDFRSLQARLIVTALVYESLIKDDLIFVIIYYGPEVFTQSKGLIIMSV